MADLETGKIRLPRMPKMDMMWGFWQRKARTADRVLAESTRQSVDKEEARLKALYIGAVKPGHSLTVDEALKISVGLANASEATRLQIFQMTGVPVGMIQSKAEARAKSGKKDAQITIFPPIASEPKRKAVRRR